MMTMECCVFCSARTIECNTLDKYQKKRKADDQEDSNAVTSDVLKCTKCNCSVSCSCLYKILESIHKTNPQTALSDPSLAVSEFVLSGEKTNKDFIGHCCELNELKKSNEIGEEDFNQPNLEINCFDD